MKFAKELQQDLVPEWRIKYFDYKTGKKKVKAVARALKNVNGTPNTPGRRLPSNLFNQTFAPSGRPPLSHSQSAAAGVDSRGQILRSTTGNEGTRESTPESPESGEGSHDRPSPIAIPGSTSPHAARVNSRASWNSDDAPNYGSFVVSPRTPTIPLGPPSLELPDPALPPEEDSFAKLNRPWRQSRLNRNPQTAQGDAFHVGNTHAPAKSDSSHLLPKHKRFLRPRRTVSTPHGGPILHRPHLLRRIFPSSGPGTPSGDVPLEAYKIFDVKQAEFFGFLDSELAKIEAFYKSKESDANRRLQILRDQLHEMRDRRMEEIRREHEAHKKLKDHERGLAEGQEGPPPNQPNGHQSAAMRMMQPIESAVGKGPSKIGKTSKALQTLGSPSGPVANDLPGPGRPESWRDFSRKPTQPAIPYRAAKRKLKLALQEFYRGLELLKSYALLNRTALRKINKKYDKAVKARPTQRYMAEKVNKAWFVQSEVLDHQIVAVEDLYARYFERGNHKVAVGKLRSKSSRAADFTGSVFRNGLLLAGGAVFGVQGVVYAGLHLQNSDLAIHNGTSYLLQIYGGYFMMLLLFLLFCLDCKVWSRAKINYPFIFEFDPRHDLDWHQLSELPCLLFFLLGLSVWLNFQQGGSSAMFLYWPVLLIGISILIIFFPGPVLYHKSRQWWIYSNFRLLLAGIYPVEFRDFFLGDMFCSLTYTMGNLEVFFCLYAHAWSNPAQCNSSHSRLLGFFSCLPGIWRALQCLRRYYDTRNAFPHLVNFGKYSFTIASYMTLSLWRIDKSTSLKALFIACSTINGIYTSTWDLAMDWSLLNPYAKHPFLREVLGYKNPMLYYIAMLLDPLLRFNWIFYAIFEHNAQHSALLSFIISLSEVCRRGMWTLFRVENEHCTNVGRFRASRDVPLPYDLPSPSRTVTPIAEAEESAQPPPQMLRRSTHSGPISNVSSSNIEAQHPSSGTLRRRANTATESETPILRGIARVGTVIHEAHAQDFERRRRPIETASPAREELERSPHQDGRVLGFESSDEDDDEDGGDEEMDRVGEEDMGPVERLRREESREGREQDAEDMLRVADVLGRRRSAVD